MLVLRWRDLMVPELPAYLRHQAHLTSRHNNWQWPGMLTFYPVLSLHVTPHHCSDFARLCTLCKKNFLVVFWHLSIAGIRHQALLTTLLMMFYFNQQSRIIRCYSIKNWKKYSIYILPILCLWIVELLTCLVNLCRLLHFKALYHAKNIFQSLFQVCQKCRQWSLTFVVVAVVVIVAAVVEQINATKEIEYHRQLGSYGASRSSGQEQEDNESLHPGSRHILGLVGSRVVGNADIVHNKSSEVLLVLPYLKVISRLDIAYSITIISEKSMTFL